MFEEGLVLATLPFLTSLYTEPSSLAYAIECSYDDCYTMHFYSRISFSSKFSYFFITPKKNAQRKRIVERFKLS